MAVQPILKPTGSVKFVKVIGNAPVIQGKPFVLDIGAGVLVFARESKSADVVQSLVYAANVCTITAQAVSSDLAPALYRLFGALYFDNETKQFTPTQSDVTVLVGRTLDNKDFTAGVSAGAQLVFEFNPDVFPLG